MIFLDRLNDKAKINFTSQMLFKFSFEYLKNKNLYLKSMNEENLPPKELKVIELKLMRSIYKRVKYNKKFKILIQ